MSKEIKFWGLPDWRLSGKPEPDLFLTVGSNSLKVDQFVEVIESDTEGSVTTEDVLKAYGQVLAKIRKVTLDEVRQATRAIRGPKLG